MGEGDSDCTRLLPGHHFKLTDHYRKDLTDRAYMVTRVLHLGEKHQDLEAGAVSARIRYSNSFRCMPRRTPFRPQLLTPKPTARGVQTAIVVGPPGEEIHTDQHGRVKVQFHWDREGNHDDTSSCWLRVSQMWASRGWGAVWIPRVGDEVIVDFIEGDTDRPIVVGAVYNAHNPPPHALPENKTVSTIKSNSSPGGGGFNEVRMEDRRGAEELYTHAQRDHTAVVRRNMATRVGQDMFVKTGRDQYITVGRDREIDVERNEHLAVDGEKRATVAGPYTVEVKDNMSITSARTIAIQATNGFEMSCGGSMIKIGPGGIDIQSGSQVKINGSVVKLNC